MKKINSRKVMRIAALLLVIVMVIGALPFTSLAAMDNGYVLYYADPSDVAGYQRLQYIQGSINTPYYYSPVPSFSSTYSPYYYIGGTGIDTPFATPAERSSFAAMQASAYGVTMTGSISNVTLRTDPYQSMGGGFVSTVNLSNYCTPTGAGTFNVTFPSAAEEERIFKGALREIIFNGFPFTDKGMSSGSGLGISWGPCTWAEAMTATNIAFQRIGYMFDNGFDQGALFGYDPGGATHPNVAQYSWYLETLAHMYIATEMASTGMVITPQRSDMTYNATEDVYERTVTISIPSDQNAAGYNDKFTLHNVDFPTGTKMYLNGSTTAFGFEALQSLKADHTATVRFTVPAIAANANKWFAFNGTLQTVFTDYKIGVFHNGGIAEGYALVADPQEFPDPDPSAYQDSTPTYAYMKTPNVATIKVLTTGVGSDAGKLPGCEVGLYKADGTLVAKGTTGSDGLYTFTNVVPGNYYAQDINVPPEYLRDRTTKYNVTAIAGQTHTVTIPHAKPQGRITLSNEDIETGTVPQGDATLNGGKWSIYNSTGTKVATLSALPTSNTATSALLPLGTYTAVQDVTPTGYLAPNPNNPAVTVTLKYKDQDTAEVSTSAVIKLQVIKGTLSIAKFTRKTLDGTPLEDGVMNPLPGTVWDISLKSKGQSYDTQTTNADGKWTSKLLPYGTYTVTETQGVEGFDLVPPFDRFITVNGKDYFDILEDATVARMVREEKIDGETGKIIPYAGMKTQILDSNKNVVSFPVLYPQPTTLDTLETDASGTNYLPAPLDAGQYYAQEICTPPGAGYLLNTEPVPFTVDDSTPKTEPIVVQIPDMPAMGTISIARTVEVLDADGNPTGEVTREGGKTGPAFDGVEVVDGVTVPKYKTVPVPDEEFDVVAMDNIVTADGTVRAEQGAVVDHIITDANGYAISKPLYLSGETGYYALVMTKAGAGMVLDPTPIPVIIEYVDENTSPVNVDVQIDNKLQLLKVSFTKTAEQPDGSYKEMAGFPFGLYAEADVLGADGEVILAKDALIASTVTGENGLGQIIAPNVLCYVREIESDANPAYLYSDTKYPVKKLPAEPTDEFVLGVINNGVAIQNHLKKMPDLLVEKTVDKQTAAPGDTVTWTITIFNNGTAAATDVVAHDTHLKGVDPFDAAGNYAIGTLEPGESKTITVTETVAGKTGDVVKNVVIVDGKDPDGDPLPPKEDEAEYTVDPVTLTVTKTVDKKEAKTGETVKWTITIKNESKVDVKDVVAHDVRLAGLAPFDGKGDYAIGDMKPGEAKTFSVSEKVVETTGTVKNVVVVNGKDPGGKDLPPKQAEAEFVVKDDGIAITKTVDKPQAAVGDTVTWTITVTNTSKGDLKDVVVTDARLRGITPFDADGKLAVGVLKAGEVKTITASEKVVAEAGTIKNVAVVNAKTPDGKDLPPKEAEAEYTVTPPAGPDITKTVDKAQVATGDTVTWTITVTNFTKTELKDVVVTDARLKGISPFDEDGKYTVGVLKPGESKEIKASEKVVAESGTVKNVVVVNAKTPDGKDLPPKEAEAEYTVKGPRLAVTKTVDKAQARQGDKVTWTITTVNDGTVDAHEVTVSDALLKGVAPFDGNGVMTVALIKVGETKVITATQTVPQANTGTVVKNVVVVNAKTPDGKPFPEASGEAQYTINPAAATTSPANDGKTGGGAQTGQDGLPYWLIAIMVIAGAGIVGIIIYLHRKKTAAYRR